MSVLIRQIESEDWQCTAPGYKQTFCIHGVRHVETLPEHEEEGGGGVDDEGVGPVQGWDGDGLTKGRDDDREYPELMFIRQAPGVGLSGCRASSGDEDDDSW